jgi:hypothetical protein
MFSAFLWVLKLFMCYSLFQMGCWHFLCGKEVPYHITIIIFELIVGLLKKKISVFNFLCSSYPLTFAEKKKKKKKRNSGFSLSLKMWLA